MQWQKGWNLLLEDYLTLLRFRLCRMSVESVPSILSTSNLLFILSWAFTIHNAQGKTLDIAAIDIRKSERCYGMT